MPRSVIKKESGVTRAFMGRGTDTWRTPTPPPNQETKLRKKMRKHEKIEEMFLSCPPKVGSLDMTQVCPIFYLELKFASSTWCSTQQFICITFICIIEHYTYQFQLPFSFTLLSPHPTLSHSVIWVLHGSAC